MKVIWMLGIVAMLTSCNQSEEMLTENSAEKTVTFTIATEQIATRAVGNELRYVVAVYDEAGTTEVKPEQTFNNGNISIILPQGKYTCLFWADHGDTEYDATNLLAVIDKKNTAADANGEAFFAKKEITVTDGGNINVSLTRAVAQIILKETEALEAGDKLKITFDRPLNFNVSTGDASNPETGFSKEISIASTIEGTTDSPVEIGNLYVLASATEALLNNLKVQYNTEAEKELANVPTRANYKTNITGKYGINWAQQFTVTVNENWNTPDIEGTMLKVKSDYTYTAPSGQSYECIVTSSDATSAVVTWKTQQPHIATLADAQSAASQLGGRVLTFAEFKILVEAGLIIGDSGIDYFCQEGRCWNPMSNVPSYDNNEDNLGNFQYYVSFDIAITQ